MIKKIVSSYFILNSKDKIIYESTIAEYKLFGILLYSKEILYEADTMDNNNNEGVGFIYGKQE